VVGSVEGPRSARKRLRLTRRQQTAVEPSFSLAGPGLRWHPFVLRAIAGTGQDLSCRMAFLAHVESFASLDGGAPPTGGQRLLRHYLDLSGLRATGIPPPVTACCG